MAPFEQFSPPGTNWPTLNLQDQREVSYFLDQFGDDLVLDAASMRAGIHTRMKDVRMELVEFWVHTGEISPDEAEVTLEAIDLAIQTDRYFTHDTLQEILDETRAANPVDPETMGNLWRYPRIAEEHPDSAAMETDDLDDEIACEEADMFGIYGMGDNQNPDPDEGENQQKAA